jgi:Clostripain family
VQIRKPVTLLMAILTLLGCQWLSAPCLAQTDDGEQAPISRIEKPSSYDLPQPEKDWTVLLYNAADFKGYNPTEDFATAIQSTGAVHVLILEDLLDGESTIWYVGGNPDEPRLISLAEWGEIDMGDDQTFSQILAFCQQYFPSRRTMAMMYQHGQGWHGACYDSHPSAIEGQIETTYLTPEEMRVSLDSVGGIEALLFTAPCIMGAMETVYQLRDSVDLYIGSEPVSSFAIWEGALDGIISLLTDEPDIPLDVLASRILDLVQTTFDREALLEMAAEEYHHLLPSAALTAVHFNSSIHALCPALDAFALALLSILDNSMGLIQQARTRTQSFGNGELVDAYDFALHCKEIPGMKLVSEELMNAVSEIVTVSITDVETFPHANGLSLYFPLPEIDNSARLAVYHSNYGFGKYGEEYQGAKLDLVDSTHWSEFLEGFFDQLLGSTAD